MTRYSYDGCGNTTQETGPAGTTRYYWDHDNRLVRLEPPTGAPQRFSYDPDGKRVAKETASGTVRYLYQRDNVLELLQERDGADSSFYHYDWLGSTQQLTDAAQAVTDTYRYDAWGNVLQASGSTVNPHTYVGRLRYYAMAGTGLYHLGHRELAAGVGRFMSVDPVREAASGYPYAQNQGTFLVDPHGLQRQVPRGTNGRAVSVPERVAALRRQLGDRECLTLDRGFRAGVFHPTYCRRTPGQRRPYGYFAKRAVDFVEHPREPLSWYRVNPLAFTGRLAVEAIVPLGKRLTRDTVAYGPLHGAMIAKWKARDQADFPVDMVGYLRASQAERDQYAAELAAAIAWAERYVRSGETAEAWGAVHAVTPVDRSEQPDLWWAIGNHQGWGRARATRRGDTFSMDFWWHLEDTYKHYGKYPSGILEQVGLCAPFYITGAYRGSYEWAAGNGSGVKPHY